MWVVWTGLPWICAHLLDELSFSWLPFSWPLQIHPFPERPLMAVLAPPGWPIATQFWHELFPWVPTQPEIIVVFAHFQVEVPVVIKKVGLKSCLKRKQWVKIFGSIPLLVATGSFSSKDTVLLHWSNCSHEGWMCHKTKRVTQIC